MLNELNIFFNIFKSQIEKKNEKGSELAAMVPMYANILLHYLAFTVPLENAYLFII
jgi:hypothetical protein